MYNISKQHNYIVNTIYSSINSQYKEKANHVQVLISDLTNAYINGLLDSAKSIVIYGNILGGTGTSGGPLSNGELTAFVKSFILPTFKKHMIFSMITTNTSTEEIVTSTKTEYWLALTDLIFDAGISCWKKLINSWKTNNLPVANGGTEGWISSVPPTSGPWLDGEITPFSLIGSFGGSIQFSYTKNFMSEVVNKAKSKKFSFTFPEGNTVKYNLINNHGTEGENFVFSCAKGLAYLMENVVTSVFVNTSNAVCTGTSLPVTGAISNGFVDGIKLDIE